MLHYAKHEDLEKTLLRSALHPFWMMESLCISEINMKDAKVVKFKKWWAIITEIKDTQGNDATQVSLVNPENDTIIGHYVYNSKGKMIASSEVKDFYTIGKHMIPKNLLIIWYEEGLTLTFNLQNPLINTEIDPKNWAMPDMNKKIDMGKE